MLVKKNSDILEKTNSTIQQINDKTQALQLNADMLQQRSLLPSEHVGNGTQQVSDLSDAQSKTLNDKCDTILELLRRQTLSGTPMSGDEAVTPEIFHEGQHGSSPAVGVDATSHDSSDHDDCLKHVLGQLLELGRDEGKAFSGQEAETILQDLEVVLNLLTEAEKQECVGNQKRKRLEMVHEQGDSGEELQYRREVKRIQEFMGVSHRVVVNEKGQYEKTHFVHVQWLSAVGMSTLGGLPFMKTYADIHP